MILISIIFTVVLGITVASYLLLVRSQYISTARSHNWNIAMVLAEAGVDDALALVNKNEGDFPNLKNWPATAAADGWTVNGNVFHVQRTPDRSLGFYDVWVTDLGNTVSIRVEGTATWDTTNPNPGDSGGNVRKLVVQAGLAPAFPVALGSGSDINLANRTFTADSFDSTDSNSVSCDWSSLYAVGKYNQAKRKASGNVASDGNVLNVSVGVKFYGNSYTGPGGNAGLKQFGSVGDLTWSSPGIQPGHGREDMNVTYPTVKKPNAIYSPLTTLSTPNTVINQPGYYQVIDSYGLQNSLTITTNNVVLWLVHGLNYNGGGVRFRLSATSSATVYVDEQFNLLNNAAIRSTNAANLIFYGLPSLTSISLDNANAFTGCLYAPQAILLIGNGGAGAGGGASEGGGGGPGGGPGGGGGGSGSYDFYGSLITGSVTTRNNVNVHYDESLRQIDSGHAPARAFVATNWTEL